MNEELDTKRASFNSLVNSSEQHLFGEDSTVLQHKATVTWISQDWAELERGLRDLSVAIQPWKDMTDRFDKLSDWFDEFEERVQRDLAATEGAEDTAAGADLSDAVVQVKDHLLKLSQLTPELLALGEAAGDVLGEEVCGEFPASEELRTSCEALAQRQERLRGQLELARQDVEQKVRESAYLVVLSREIPLYVWVRGKNHGTCKCSTQSWILRNLEIACRSQDCVMRPRSLTNA